MSNEVSHTNGTDGCDPHEYTVIRYCQLNSTSLVGKTVQFQIEARIIDQKIVSNPTSQRFDFPEPPIAVGLSTGLLILSCNYVLAYAITGIVLLTCCKPLWNKRFDLVIAYILVGVTGLGCVVAGYMLSDTVNEDISLALTIVGLVISLVSLSIVIAIIVFVIKSKHDKRDGSLTQAVNKGLLDMTPVSNEQ
ncbi:uncharacterized protein LOC132562750 [Ylistrum balloti]|uniref:uncharacterized protein LOC132562750 n=1 Tax=Ylistrum balloti TaxID=509963 RepID=UPI002905C521|nr:uncharacterized protein LOC132562750 [Ylistrum balloti]